MTTFTAGLGFKPEHFEPAHACSAAGLWYEVHAENYMTGAELIQGGPRLAMLDALCDRHPVSVHGVGLSLASSERPNASHLRRLAAVVQRTQAVLVSEHLAWCRWRGVCVPDLLPFPRTHEALLCLARNIDEAQSVLGRRLLIENPSLYMRLEHEYDEVDFLMELVRRTGCGLLVDINNVFVSAHNLGYSAHDYLRRLPAEAVGEIHLAGHSPDAGGSSLLIDTHAAPVCAAVWTLYREFITRVGAVPTLIERDDALPAFDVLLSERDCAAGLMMATNSAEQVHVIAG